MAWEGWRRARAREREERPAPMIAIEGMDVILVVAKGLVLGLRMKSMVYAGFAS